MTTAVQLPILMLPIIVVATIDGKATRADEFDIGERFLRAPVAAILAAAAPGSANREASWEGRFLAEAPRAWMEYRRLMADVAGEYSMRFTITTSNVASNVDSHHHSKRIRRGTHRLSHSISHDLVNDRTEESVIGSNRHYRFHISRAGGEQGWLLREIERQTEPGGDKFSPEVIANRLSLRGRVFGSFHSFGLLRMAPARELEEWFDGDSFEVVSVTPLPGSDPPLVEVRCRINDPPIGPGDAVWIMAPHQHWTLRAYTVSFRDRESGEVVAQWNFEAEIADEAASLAIPLSTRQWMETAAGRRMNVEFSDIRLDPNAPAASAREFYLSAFGLPEPTWARRSTPWYLYIAGVGILVIILGAVAMRLARR